MIKLGTISPKSRSPFLVTLGYTSSSDYFAGRENSDIERQQVWARNQHQADLLAWELDTRNGTPVGWEMLSCVPA